MARTLVNQSTLPVMSLFSGAGGLDLGFKSAGFTSVLAVDHDVAATETFRRNHPETRVEQADLASLTSTDLISMWREVADTPPLGIIGGPPCQAFSLSNARPRATDARRELSFAYARHINELNREFQLQFFVFENVRGLTSPRNSSHFFRLQDDFRDAGFEIHIGQLNASEFGVPQSRRRLFIVGLNSQLPWSHQYCFPGAITTKHFTVSDAIRNLPDPAFFSRDLSREDIPHHPNHWTMVPKSVKFNRKEGSSNAKLGRSFRVIEWDRPSPTVAYGNREVHVHPNGDRRLSVLEAMLLQGFPDSYVLAGNLSEQFRQISDAVPPPMAFAIASSIIDLRLRNE